MRIRGLTETEVDYYKEAARKRIKEEVVKWLGIVSNEIEIIEIDTDCKSMK